ncbi:MAG: aspartate kinase [Oscillospiraceae bacterium]|nr:aspartate kinase [Oscillospiraceae bacterium]
MLIVRKYGGSSLADGERIRKAAQSVAGLVAQGHRVVVVVSAQGDTTDLLLAQSRELTKAPDLRELDQYLAAGEQMSAGLMAMALQELGVHGMSLTGAQAGILTDGSHGDARILTLCTDRIRRELDRGRTVVVAGFQGVDRLGDITTLGRGGSDTTAVALAAWLGAERCEIFTDVDGVYDKDPRRFPDAVRLEKIGYDRMLQMAKEGAQVLHDRSVELAKDHQVPVWVRSSFRPGQGTLVCDL